jgi:hypothetical protein
MGSMHLPIRANPQAAARSRRFGSYQNVSRETFWYDLGQKPYNAEDSGPFFDHVKSEQFFGAIRGEAAAPRRPSPLPQNTPV